MGIEGPGQPKGDKPIVPSEEVKEGREFSLETLKDCHKYLPATAEQKGISPKQQEEIGRIASHIVPFFKFLGL